MIGMTDRKLRIADIRAAAARIRADVRRTPLEKSEPLGRRAGADVRIKWESEQETGSFKLRGALNKLRVLSSEERWRGIVSASTGNHGLAIGRAARLEGVDLTLFLPETVTEVKRRKIEALGVPLRFYGDDCGKTESHARAWAERDGRIFVSPYNDLDIIRGQGTLGLEADEDFPDVQDVFIPIGGGGLAAGVAAAMKATVPGVRIFGVEPENSAFLEASFRAGRLVDIQEKPTVADALAGGIEPGSITFALCRAYLNGILTVGEGLIVRAMALLAEHHGRMVEGAGAVALAGFLAHAREFRGRRALCIVSGGNIASDKFLEIVRGAV
jgi:threonine dehydratase